MPDGFETVRKKRQRKRKGNPEILNLGDNYDSKININKKLENALEEFQTSPFCAELLQAVDKSLVSCNLNSIEEILCFGLGNFSESKSSLHQLAALIKLKTNYISIVSIYDPIFTPAEIEVLEKLNFNILPENEEGKRKVGSKGTLVFLPHCPKQLTNNFLWANWNSSLSSCIIVANSFSRIIQDNTRKNLQESARYIVKIQPKTIELSLDNCYHIDNIFNDISIHYFSPNLNPNFFTETLEDEPVYKEDIEFITKKLTVLNRKNE